MTTDRDVAAIRERHLKRQTAIDAGLDWSAELPSGQKVAAPRVAHFDRGKLLAFIAQQSALLDRYREALGDCELALSVWDESRSSEYWFRRADRDDAARPARSVKGE